MKKLDSNSWAIIVYKMSSYFIYIAALKTVYKVPHSQTELEEVETRRQKKKKKKKKKAQTHTYTYMHTYIDTHIG